MKNVINFLQSHNYQHILLDEPLARHTTFRVGGRADIIVTPVTKTQLLDLIFYLSEKDIPFRVIGNGSNLLPADKPYKGVIIKPHLALSSLTVDGEIVTVEGGYSSIRLAYEMIKYQLTGLEFLGGIPGTLGGACFMNAGAYNCEMKDVVLEVECLTHQGVLKTFTNEKLRFGYRRCLFQEERPLLITKAILKLAKGNGEEIRALLEKRKNRRRASQPLEYPSAGSTFRNPVESPAYKLIDEAGLRGKRLGGAKVSEKHCNFIINFDKATGQDIKMLINLVIERVFQVTNVCLIPEVEFFNW